eukprot:CAMPEP_0174868236 /NCGR_PEP_ID=MMETSP1114-20130205/65588_1 /TAXON_ID=312471 /ORGANISM="Neobodo designis, Strain CCAP 1951/1" /LENGTH=179 /DNA_ID=CAMNT_0016103453 /DNA_START=143 /DNA_END=678 /DNA_ORIENTATION=-
MEVAVAEDATTVSVAPAKVRAVGGSRAGRTRGAAGASGDSDGLTVVESDQTTTIPERDVVVLGERAVGVCVGARTADDVSVGSGDRDSGTVGDVPLTVVDGDEPADTVGVAVGTCELDMAGAWDVPAGVRVPGRRADAVIVGTLDRDVVILSEVAVGVCVGARVAVNVSVGAGGRDSVA